ncbi:MAG: hypothetical protein H6765_08695 [Candidatus Peribacteria bacterium]|nr:MAG: hypothetical protein H6765_08695 [Candidatus Peribacteria bacterium]
MNVVALLFAVVFLAGCTKTVNLPVVDDTTDTDEVVVDTGAADVAEVEDTEEEEVMADTGATDTGAVVEVSGAVAVSGTVVVTTSGDTTDTGAAK